MAISFSNVRPVIIASAAIAVLVPLALVVAQSLISGPIFGAPARPNLDAFATLFADREFRRAFGSTLTLASSMTAIAAPLGALFGFLVVRTNLPGRRWLEPIILVPMVVSSIILAFGYAVTLAPDGFLPAVITQRFGMSLWNVHSFSWMVVIAGLIHVPYAYIFTATALRTQGAEAEEAARVAGAGPMRIAFEVSLPAALPAILVSGALIFLLGFELFGLPLVLGGNDGRIVLSTYLAKLTAKIGIEPHQLTAAVVVSILAAALPLILVQRLLARRAQHRLYRYTEFHRRTPLRLGRWRWPAFFLIMIWIAIAVVLPLGGLALRSAVKWSGDFSGLSGAFTADHYRTLLGRPDIVRSVINAAALGVVGSAIALLCYRAVALAISRRRPHWRSAVEDLAMLPRALPGIVAGLAVVWLFLTIKPLAAHATSLPALWLAYSLVWFALGVFVVTRTMDQVPRELEDVARTMGASQTQVARDVTAPLVRSGMVACWLLIGLVFVRDYATGVYLLGRRSGAIGPQLVSLWNEGAVELAAALSVVNIAMIGIAFAVLVCLGMLRVGVRPHG